MEASFGAAHAPSKISHRQVDSPIGAVRNPETAHGVEHAYDFHDPGGLGDDLATFITGDPLAILFGSAKTVAVGILLILVVKLGKVLHITGRDDANIIDEAGNGACCVGTTREAKAIDFVSGGVVEDEEVIGVDDVAHEADAEACLPVRLCLA